MQITAGLSPLVELKPQLVGPPTPLYRVTVHGSSKAPVNRIRLAALDTFDGALWSQSGTFVLAGSQLPHPAAPSAGSDVVTLEVAVLTGRSPYLPVVGQPLTLRGTTAAIEEDSGSLVRATSDDAAAGPVSYTLTARIAREADIDTAGPAEAPARLTALPDVPSWVSDEAQKAKADWETPWTQLSELENYLEAHPYAADARPGHSYGAVKRMLVGDATEPGNAEQHASAFAILARSLGYPTRVAVGLPAHRRRTFGRHVHGHRDRRARVARGAARRVRLGRVRAHRHREPRRPAAAARPGGGRPALRRRCRPAGPARRHGERRGGRAARRCARGGRARVRVRRRRARPGRAAPARHRRGGQAGPAVPAPARGRRRAAGGGSLARDHGPAAGDRRADAADLDAARGRAAARGATTGRPSARTCPRSPGSRPPPSTLRHLRRAASRGRRGSSRSRCASTSPRGFRWRCAGGRPWTLARCSTRPAAGCAGPRPPTPWRMPPTAPAPAGDLVAAAGASRQE